MSNQALAATALTKVTQITSITSENGRIASAAKFAAGVPLKVAAIAFATFESLIRAILLIPAMPLKLISPKTFTNLTEKTFSAVHTILDATKAIVDIHAKQDPEKTTLATTPKTPKSYLNDSIDWAKLQLGKTVSTVQKNKGLTATVVGAAIVGIALYYSYPSLIKWFQGSAASNNPSPNPTTNTSTVTSETFPTLSKVSPQANLTSDAQNSTTSNISLNSSAEPPLANLTSDAQNSTTSNISSNSSTELPLTNLTSNPQNSTTSNISSNSSTELPLTNLTSTAQNSTTSNISSNSSIELPLTNLTSNPQNSTTSNISSISSAEPPLANQLSESTSFDFFNRTVKCSKIFGNFTINSLDSLLFKGQPTLSGEVNLHLPSAVLVALIGATVAYFYKKGCHRANSPNSPSASSKSTIASNPYRSHGTADSPSETRHSLPKKAVGQVSSLAIQLTKQPIVITQSDEEALRILLPRLALFFRQKNAKPTKQAQRAQFNRLQNLLIQAALDTSSLTCLSPSTIPLGNSESIFVTPHIAQILYFASQTSEGRSYLQSLFQLSSNNPTQYSQTKTLKDHIHPNSSPTRIKGTFTVLSEHTDNKRTSRTALEGRSHFPLPTTIPVAGSTNFKPASKAQKKTPNTKTSSTSKPVQSSSAATIKARNKRVKTPRFSEKQRSYLVRKFKELNSGKLPSMSLLQKAKTSQYLEIGAEHSIPTKEADLDKLIKKLDLALDYYNHISSLKTGFANRLDLVNELLNASRKAHHSRSLSRSIKSRSGQLSAADQKGIANKYKAKESTLIKDNGTLGIAGRQKLEIEVIEWFNNKHSDRKLTRDLLKRIVQTHLKSPNLKTQQSRTLR